MTRSPALVRYSKKRKLAISGEPAPRMGKAGGHAFVIQKHAARRLHYDFRLELDGVLKSWAIPKGPSLRAGDKRLAVQVEDHPVDYADFEGTIPKGQYGGGEVIVWDKGTWSPVGDPREGLAKGRLSFTLEGERLRGKWALVRLDGRRGESREGRASWLLLKSADEFAKTGRSANVTEQEQDSVLTARTIEDIATGVRAGGPKRATRRQEQRRTVPSRRSTKRTSGQRRMPHELEPQLCTLVERPPTDPGWIFETKVDGYRAIAFIERGGARIVSRNGLDWTERFPSIAAALGRIRVASAVVDGEICFFEKDGKTSFQRLQNAMKAGTTVSLVFVAFDLLYRDGEDIRAWPLGKRKDALRTILAGENLPLRFSDHVEGQGTRLFDEACRLGLEGIIGKRIDAPYASGRTRTWIKVKCTKQDEFVIVGFTPPRGKRAGLGSIIVATRPAREQPLRLAGKVGTGFDTATLRDLEKRLRSLVTRESPLPPPRRVPGVRDALWVKPELVCEVGFTEWTDDERLRHPVFLGLREDKSAAEVMRETPHPVSDRKRSDGSYGVTITHPDRVIDPACGATKGELAAYYGTVAERMLVFAGMRPLTLVRCPDGVTGGCFFQKHAPKGLPKQVHRARIGSHSVLYVDSPEGVIALAQFGVIELHGWGCQLPDWQHPNWIVIDLDPGEGVPFSDVVRGALEIRRLLEQLELRSFVKTTGGRGLHVVLPIEPDATWTDAKAFARGIAEGLAESAPSNYVSTASKQERRGKVFVDYLRNGEEATVVLPFSARARPNLPVAMPVEWRELERLDPAKFTISTVPELLGSRRRDPWSELASTKQRLPKLRFPT